MIISRPAKHVPRDVRMSNKDRFNYRDVDWFRKQKAFALSTGLENYTGLLPIESCTEYSQIKAKWSTTPKVHSKVLGAQYLLHCNEQGIDPATPISKLPRLLKAYKMEALDECEEYYIRYGLIDGAWNPVIKEFALRKARIGDEVEYFIKPNKDDEDLWLEEPMEDRITQLNDYQGDNEDISGYRCDDDSFFRTY